MSMVTNQDAGKEMKSGPAVKKRGKKKGNKVLPFGNGGTSQVQAFRPEDL